MNWKNTTENLVITLISIIVGIMLGYFITSRIMNTVIKSNQKILIEAIKKPTTNYDIKNKKGDLKIPILNEDSVNRKHGWFIFKDKKRKN